MKIYYNYSEIGNKEINELFGQHSSATVSKLKKMVKSEMDKQNTSSYGANKVNTSIAYSIWGINVIDLERRRKKLQELSL